MNVTLTEELNRMPDPSLNPCEGVEQAYEAMRAERDRLAAENEALCGHIEICDKHYPPEWWSVLKNRYPEEMTRTRAAIEPILAARRAE